MTALAPFAIGEVSIRQHEGLFSLNDLHKASGSIESQRPNQFLRIDQTKALIQELKTAQICAVKTKEGRNGGTYACRELVIAYAAWISAAFHLKVIRVFLDVAAPAQPTTITPAQQQHLKELVDLVVESGKQKSHAETWARLHRKFGVPRYTELPAAQFHSACLYLKSKIDQPSIATLIRKHLPAQIEALDLTGGPAAQAAHEAACQYIDNLRSGQQTRWDLPPEVLQGLVLDALMSQRFIVSFGYGQGMSIKPIARDAYVLPSSKWASAIESGDAHLPPEELARLHAVVSAKISRSYLLMHSQRKAQPPALA